MYVEDAWQTRVWPRCGGRLADPGVTLRSSIISNTPYDEIEYWAMSKKDLEDRHGLFQKEDKRTYIRNMLDRILSDVSSHT